MKSSHKAGTKSISNNCQCGGNRSSVSPSHTYATNHSFLWNWAESSCLEIRKGPGAYATQEGPGDKVQTHTCCVFFQGQCGRCLFQLDAWICKLPPAKCQTTPPHRGMVSANLSQVDPMKNDSEMLRGLVTRLHLDDRGERDSGTSRVGF